LGLKATPKRLFAEEQRETTNVAEDVIEKAGALKFEARDKENESHESKAAHEVMNLDSKPTSDTQINEILKENVAAAVSEKEQSQIVDDNPFDLTTEPPHSSSPAAPAPASASKPSDHSIEAEQPKSAAKPVSITTTAQPSAPAPRYLQQTLSSSAKSIPASPVRTRLPRPMPKSGIKPPTTLSKSLSTSVLEDTVSTSKPITPVKRGLGLISGVSGSMSVPASAKKQKMSMMKVDLGKDVEVVIEKKGFDELVPDTVDDSIQEDEHAKEVVEKEVLVVEEGDKTLESIEGTAGVESMLDVEEPEYLEAVSGEFAAAGVESAKNEPIAETPPPALSQSTAVADIDSLLMMTPSKNDILPPPLSNVGSTLQDTIAEEEKKTANEQQVEILIPQTPPVAAQRTPSPTKENDDADPKSARKVTFGPPVSSFLSTPFYYIPY
jgi:hypothetical protein